MASDPSLILASLVGHFLETPLDGGLIKDLLLDPASTPDEQSSTSSSSPTLDSTSTSLQLSSSSLTTITSTSPPSTSSSLSSSEPSTQVDVSSISDGARAVIQNLGAKSAALAANTRVGTYPHMIHLAVIGALFHVISSSSEIRCDG
jgi:hypothetical protein